jgi:ribosome-binding factor A
MPRDFSRASRVSEVIQREGLSARIYFIMQGDKKTIKEAEKVLNKAAGFIRHELTNRIELRYIPKLHFAYDQSIERGLRVGKLIDDVMLDEKEKNKE